jgi:hypothetical protein
MKSFRALLIVSLILVGPAVARPLLIAPIRLSLPPTVPFAGFEAPVIDGDTVMVAALQSGSGDRVHTVNIFERASNGTWNYAGILTEGYVRSVGLDGNLAVVDGRDDIRVFERGAQGWTQTATIDSGPQGYDNPIGVDDGAIFMRHYRSSSTTGCVRADWVLRKVNGQWTEVATVGAPRCDDDRIHYKADINDGRVLIMNQRTDPASPQPPADVLVDTGAATWTRVAGLNPPSSKSWGSSATISNHWAAVGSSYLYRNNGGNDWVYHAQRLDPEIELYASSSYSVIRGDSLVIQGFERDYELPFLVYEVPNEFRTLRVFRPRANGFFDYYAKLAVDFSVFDWSVSSDGRRVVATCGENNYETPVKTLMVFEIPESVSFAGTQQDNFESGNFARWTPTAGIFSVATNGATRVLRQSSLTGDAGAYLTAIDWRDQSIEADLRPLEYFGNDRWFGLVARRVDANNYYYVTFRAGGQISLRRVLNGVVTQLANNWAIPPFQPGRNYRVRLEAVGDQLAVSVDGIPRLYVKDTSFTHGHPGIAGYRTRFEADNVMVSSATRLLVRLDTTQEQVPSWAPPPPDLTGTWTSEYDPDSNSFITRQSATTGNARWFSRVNIGNQVISARVRPMSYGTTTGSQDPWVGIAAHVVNEQNFHYLSLRRSGQVSLRRVVNGSVQVLACAPLNVSTGAWYDLRLEMIGKDIRAFVNGDLKLQVVDSSVTGGGRNALLMYKTAADAASYVAYQP